MAKAKRNMKTHPKPQDTGIVDPFTDPSREDQLGEPDRGRSEMVDVFGASEVVDTGVVDMNSGAEGDARSMSTESDGDPVSRAEPGTSRVAQRDGNHARGDGSGDGANYSQKVRARIARERALVNRERTLREQTQRELGEERAARQALTERLDRIERAQTEVTGNADVKALEAKIAALIPQLETATEAGDTKKALALQIQLSDLQGDLKLLKHDLKQRATAPVEKKEPAQPRLDTTAEVDPRAAESAEAFKRANRHWWNRSANKEAREDAITIDREILEDLRTGELDFEPYSDEHWEEVARRLHETYPQLEIQDLSGTAYEFDEGGEMKNERDPQNNRRQQTSPPMRPAQNNGRRPSNEVDLARQGKVILDQDDFNTMRLFKMDPHDEKAKKYFAQEKRRSILTGDRNAQRGNRS